MFFLMISVMMIPTTYVIGKMNYNVVKPLGGDYHIRRYSVKLIVNGDASVSVEENITYIFESGSFSYAYRYINYWKLDDVINIEVGEVTDSGIVWYEKGGSGEGHFTVNKDPDRVLIKWYYSPVYIETNSVEKTFIIRYKATAVIEAENGKNILDWDGIPADTPKVDIARVQVVIPRNLNSSDLEIQPSNDAVLKITESTIITFYHENIPEGLAYRIIVKFPKFIEPVFSFRKYFNQNWILLTIMVIIFSTLTLVIAWYLKGRDQKISPSKRRLIESKYKTLAYGQEISPPDLTPTEATVLINERITPITWGSLIFDLATRGYFKIVNKDSKTFIEFTEKTNQICISKTDSKLKSFEADFLNFVCKIYNVLKEKKRLENTLIPIRKFFGEFYSFKNRKIRKKIEDEIYNELLAKGFFDADPREIGKRWAYLYLISLIPFGAIMVSGILNNIFGLIFLGFGGITASIFLAIGAYSFMPRKTLLGSEKAYEVKQYAINLLEKIRTFAKAKDDRLKETISLIFGSLIAWLFIVKKGVRLIPNDIENALRGYPLWYPYWYHYYPSASPKAGRLTATDITSFISNINNSFQSFMSAIRVSGGGGGGVGGGGGAGGGGAGAG